MSRIALDWSNYRAQIDANHPPLVVLYNATVYNGNHAVVGTGYQWDDYSGQMMIVNDAWGPGHTSNYKVAFGTYDSSTSVIITIDPSGTDPGSPNIGYGSRTLSYGSSGNDVAEMQARLDAQNYSLGSIDGIFGNMTKNAVINFQRNNGLTADGIVGPLTTSKLKSYDYQTNFTHPNY